MNEQLKPVAATSQEDLEIIADGCAALMYPPGVFSAGDSYLYAIPPTHRVVSVELLRNIEKFADEAQSHYSGMNDEVCQSYSEPWQQALIIMGLVGAIIDNKE